MASIRCSEQLSRRYPNFQANLMTIKALATLFNIQGHITTDNWEIYCREIKEAIQQHHVEVYRYHKDMKTKMGEDVFKYMLDPFVDDLPLTLFREYKIDFNELIKRLNEIYYEYYIDNGEIEEFVLASKLFGKQQSPEVDDFDNFENALLNVSGDDDLSLFQKIIRNGGLKELQIINHLFRHHLIDEMDFDDVFENHQMQRYHIFPKLLRLCESLSQDDKIEFKNSLMERNDVKLYPGDMELIYGIIINCSYFLLQDQEQFNIPNKFIESFMNNDSPLYLNNKRYFQSVLSKYRNR